MSLMTETDQHNDPAHHPLSIQGVNVPLPPSPSPSSSSPPSPLPSPKKSTFGSTPHPLFLKVVPSSDQATAATKKLAPPASPTSPNGAPRLESASHSPRQSSIISAWPSDVSSLAARRALRHSREPLLPIGVSPKSPNMTATARQSTAEPGTPSSQNGASRMRNSVDKLFPRRERTGETSSSPPSPKYPGPNTSPRPTPLRGSFSPSDIELHTPRSPRFVGQLGTTSSSSDQFPMPRSPSTHSASAAATAAGAVAAAASRHRRFSAMPPPDANPFVPSISSKSGRPKRNYEGYPSKNTFFCKGQLLTGGDTLLPFLGSVMLVFGLAGTWFGTTAVWWWRNESPAVAVIVAYLCLVTISSMLATALRDPGILPRNLDPDPPYPATSPSDGAPRQPLPRDLRVGEVSVRSKYCNTCKSYRPPRSIHCKMCDNCVDACDHHCQWVNNCIGRRNYTSFITFIVIATITLILVIITAALHLALLSKRESLSFGKTLHTAPGSAVVFCVGLAVLGPLGSLLGFHLRLLVYNTTTIEQIRKKAERKWGESSGPNPWSFGRWYRNVAYMLCHPAGYTWIQADAVTMEDKREINPGAYELLGVGEEEEDRR